MAFTHSEQTTREWERVSGGETPVGFWVVNRDFVREMGDALWCIGILFMDDRSIGI